MAYDHPGTCYDREYLFQFMELDPVIHRQAEEQVYAIATCDPLTNANCPQLLNVQTEPYHPRYFLINGRAMPDDMDPDYAPNYRTNPITAIPHASGRPDLLRTIGQGRWEHPFHEHGNHVRILARDGNLILSQNDNNQSYPRLGGRMDSRPIPIRVRPTTAFFTGPGKASAGYLRPQRAGPTQPPCIPDTNGFYTVNSTPPASLNAPTISNGAATTIIPWKQTHWVISPVAAP